MTSAGGEGKKMTSAGGGNSSGEIYRFPKIVVATDEELEIRNRIIDQRGFSKFQLWGSDMPNFDIKSTPLLEVFSVSVHSHYCPLEIYGTIKVTNGLGHAFDLYNREHDNPEFINPYKKTNYSNYLSLIRPKDGRVIIPYEYVTVDVDLRDRAQDDILIAKGKLFLDFKESLFTEHASQRIDGTVGNAILLHYAAFPYALTATVDLLFFSKDDDYDTIDYDPDDYENDYADYECGGFGNDDAVANVCGIVAAHTNFFGSSSYGDNTAISSILLNVSRDQCVRVKSRTFIELSRSVVAVPAYPISSLQIHVDFKYNDGSKLADGVLEYRSDGCWLIKKDIVGENGRIRVRVQWGDAYEQRYRGSDLKRSLNEISTPKSEESSMELFKRQRHLADPQPSSAVSDWLPLSPVLEEKQDYCACKKPMQLLEVFSVGIGSNDWKPPFKLYGTIRLDSYCHLFDRDVNSPQICYDKIEVKFNHHNGFFIWDDFGIYIDLKDVEGNVLIKGQIPWTVRRFDQWYDKRICSLIRGDHGYVAVHYTMISDGVQARVKVFLQGLSSSLNLFTKFFGRLVARYSNHDYLSSYDKKYYQSLLFECGSDDRVNLKEDGIVPLSKSLVCFPRKSSLVIEVDLEIVVEEADLTVGGDVLQGTVEFSVDGGQSSKVIAGNNFWINISVEWPGVW